MANLLGNIKFVLLNDIRKSTLQLGSLFHTTAGLDKKWNTRNMGPKKFVEYNKTVFPPQSPDEEPRPAVRCSTTLRSLSLISHSFPVRLSCKI